MIAVRLQLHIEKRFQRLATRTGRTKAYYAKEALLRYMEDMQDECLALSRIENPTKRWPLDELEKGLDLERLNLEG